MNVNKLIFLTLVTTVLLTSTGNAHAFEQAEEPAHINYTSSDLNNI